MILANWKQLVKFGLAAVFRSLYAAALSVNKRLPHPNDSFGVQPSHGVRWDASVCK